MQYLLSRASRSILKRLAQEHTLCAFDFDGTLSPITENPQKAVMRIRTRRLLGRLAALFPCVVISGRARTDLLSKLGGLKLAGVIGNHGAETERTTRKPTLRVRQWKAVLEREIGSGRGIWVEEKGYSLAVHYRQAPGKAASRKLIFAAAGRLQGARVFGGKQVVNIVPLRSLHKGEALARERARLKCKCVLYLGDDENDEDAFALGGDVIAVRIGRKRRSHADYYLRGQEEVDTLLEQLMLINAV